MSELRAAQVNPRPDFIDFGIGQPGFDLLPAQALQRAAQTRLDGRDSTFLNYGIEQGDGFFRHALAAFLTGEYGWAVDPDELFVTTGASTALSLICTLFTRRGDVVFVEEPTYFLALRIFEDHGLQVVGLPMDGAGIDPEALEMMARRHRPVFLYTIPTFQNPTGVTLSGARRERLVALAREYGFLIVADEVYHSLAYSTTPPAPLAAHTATQQVISIGSFSKILAPGLRVGWLQAAPDLIARFVSCGLLDSGGGLNPFTSALLQPLLDGGEQGRYLDHLRGVYGTRIATLDAALRSALAEYPQGDIRFDRPDGGFFFWLRLPNGMDADALQQQAAAEGVGYQPGVRFSSRGGLQNRMRLSFAFYDEPALEEGARRLARVLQLGPTN
jgi:DNA-binding transcriptional MocR family regulator